MPSLSPDMALGDIAKGSSVPMSTTERSLIVAVDGTAAMGPYWKTIVSDYLEKIVRAFVGNEVPAQRSNCDLSLVMFNSHGSLSACMVQRSAWTKDVSCFLEWLSAMSFSGGGFNDAAIAEGLSEALMMFPLPLNGNLPPQSLDGKRHCVLVAATNPYPLSTPVYQPTFQLEDEHVETYSGKPLCDAEGVAKFFPQCCVSLSVICPKQLPKLRAIYNAGKRNPRAADPPVDNGKNTHFLVLIAENFLEARTALSRPGTASLPSNQSPVKMDTTPPPVNSVTAQPPASVPPVSLLSRQAVSAGNGPPAIVKVEPTTVTSMAAGPNFSHIPSVQRPTTQGVSALQTSSPSSVSQDMVTNNESVQDLKPVVSAGIPQTLRPVVPANSNILNNLSQVRQVVNSATLTGGTSIGLQSMGQNPMAMHMSNMISSGMQSTVPAAQTGYSSGQSGITSVTGPGTLSGTIPSAQNPGLGSFASATSNITGNSNIGMSQPTGNLQVGPGMGQTAPGMSQGSLSGSQMVQNGVGMNPNMMSSLGPTAPSSGSGTMMPTPGMPSQGQSGMSSINGNSNPGPGASMPLSQQSSSALQSAQSKYVKVWEGNLSGQRQGQPVLITRLEGYRSASASETLAANWPPTMQIVRLISQDHMNNKQYVGKADFLVFRAMNQHGFLGQLQEKKLCAVIQLPSQTLLLSVSDKACRLIGMLFPGDMVVFKPQIPSQQQQQQMQQQQQQMQQQLQAPPHPQMQQQQLPQMQQQQQMPQQLQPQHQQMQMMPQQQQQMQQLQSQMPQLQQQQQPPQQHLQQLQPQHPQQQQLQQLQQHAPQQLMGSGMGQGYVQGPGRSQLMPQGPVSSQGLPNMPGGGFMS